MMAEHDAGLVIGDPALKVDRSRYLTYDLAEEWIRFTGKPFVFAFWAVRQAALQGCSSGPRSGCHISGLTRPWFAAAESRPDCPRMGATPGFERGRNNGLSD